MEAPQSTLEEAWKSISRPARFNPVIVVALLIPIAGWTMSLSNRVAVLESQSLSLTTAAVEIASLKQEITDFRNEFAEWKVETRNKPEFPTPPTR